MYLRSILSIIALLIPASVGYSAEPYRIGILLSLTGSEEPLGREAMKGIRIAHKLRSKVLARPVEIVVADAKSDPSRATLAMQRLIERYRVSAIIGDVTSKCTIACSRLAERKKIPLVSLAGACFRGKADYGYTRWTGIPAKDLGATSAVVCRELLGAGRAAILRDESEEYNVAVAEEFASEFVKRGGEVVYRIGVSAGKLYFVKDLEEIMLRRPDVLFAPLSAVQYALLARQARKIGLTANIVATNRADQDELIKTGGQDADGFYLVSHDPRARLGEEFASKILKMCDTSERNRSVSWELAGAGAYRLLLDAVERARSFDSEHVLRAVMKEQAVCGATGLSHNGKGRSAFCVRRLENGRFKDPDAGAVMRKLRTTNALPEGDLGLRR